MKGFSPRERIGLISLATVVAGCCLVGMINWGGCVRNSSGISDTRHQTYEVSKSDSALQKSKAERAKSHRDSTHSYKNRKKSRTKTKGKTTKPKDPPERRSLRDEHL